jgi:hypothetical protein
MTVLEFGTALALVCVHYALLPLYVFSPKILVASPGNSVVV